MVMTICATNPVSSRSKSQKQQSAPLMVPYRWICLCILFLKIIELNLWSWLWDQFIISETNFEISSWTWSFHSCFLGCELQSLDSFHGCVILQVNLGRDQLVDVNLGNNLASKNLHNKWHCQNMARSLAHHWSCCFGVILPNFGIGRQAVVLTHHWSGCKEQRW